MNPVIEFMNSMIGEVPQEMFWLEYAGALIILLMILRFLTDFLSNLGKSFMSR